MARTSAEVLDEALASYNQMRATEGKKLAEDIGGRLTTIETLTGKVEERSPETVREYREKLTARMQEVLQSTTIDESRILTEAAILRRQGRRGRGDRASALACVAAARHAALRRAFMGRKMDFLIQEVNRESNTIGSKCNDVAIARDVVALKAEVEKIREQVQNIGVRGEANEAAEHRIWQHGVRRAPDRRRQP
ncbi:MAG: endoribonuclease YicC domain-containing protein [Oscillibacter sp.]